MKSALEVISNTDLTSILPEIGQTLTFHHNQNSPFAQCGLRVDPSPTFEFKERFNLFFEVLTQTTDYL